MVWLHAMHKEKWFTSKWYVGYIYIYKLLYFLILEKHLY
jgi:hypothetical protein